MATERTGNGRFATGNRVRTVAARKKREHAAETHEERKGRRATRLSLRRARALPDRPPTAEIAKDLPQGNYQFDHPGYGLTPARLVSIIYGAEGGDISRLVRLIDDLVKADCTLRNMLEQRRGAVSSKPREIQADGTEGDSKLAAEILGWALADLPMKAVLDHLLMFNQNGFAAVEIDWGLRLYKGKPVVVPVWFTCVPASRFTVDVATDELRLLTEKEPTKGVELEPGKWWVIRRGSGPVASAGLGITFAWPALYKRYGVTDWVVYARKFGLPLAIVKVPEKASKGVKQTAQDIVDNIGSDGGAMVETPSDGVGEVAVEIHETKGADSSSTHGALAAYCDMEMARLIYGSTLTNSNPSGSGGSYALANVHAEVRYENVEDDTAILQETFYMCVSSPMVQWNKFADGTRGPCMEIQISRNQDQGTQMGLLKQAKDFGVPVSATQVRHVTGAREPLGPDDALGGETDAAIATGADASRTEPAGKVEQSRDPSHGAPAADNVQQTALNGAQVTSLLEIVQLAASGQISRDSAKASLILSFQISPTQADQVLGPADFKPTPTSKSPIPTGPKQPPVADKPSDAPAVAE